MAITLNGTTGISSPGGDTSTSLATTNLSYTGTLTGGTGVIAIGTNQIYKDASGNIGLGVVPSAWSQGRAIELAGTGYGVWNGTGSMYMLANAYFNSGFKYASTAQASHYYQYQGAHVWSTAPSGTAGNAITFGDPKMTLDANGNLLVGSTSIIAGYSNQISSTGPTTNRGCIIAGRTTAATSGVCGSLIAYNGSNTVCGFDFQANGANNNGFIQSYTYNAGVFAQGPYLNTGGTSWTTASDEKLKDISGVIENALEKTASLRAIEYTLKSDPSRMERVGLVAQEVQKVLPQAVSVDPEGYLGVQYTDTIPLLVAAIKELTTRLEALESK